MEVVPPPATASDSRSADDPGALTVLYDGSCPLCRREIALYRTLTPLRPLAFADVGDPACPLPGLPSGTTREQLLARFHVRQADGRLDGGARAFLALWAALPGWRVLARAGNVPGVPVLLEAAYCAFLRVRPALQRVAGALDRRAAAGRARPDPGAAASETGSGR